MNIRQSNSPQWYAQKMFEELGQPSPKDMTMEDIAWSCGLVVKTVEMDGSEGRIIMNNDSGIVTINSSIAYQPKINYIIAHEIGHFRMHRDLCFFSDSPKTLQEWLTHGPHEQDANEFAAELLMPAGTFKKMVYKRKLDLKLIEEVATHFVASKTATFLRYRDLGEYPLMIIFIENGKIKWKSHNNDFPFKWLSHGSEVPALTVAGDFYYKGIEEDRPAKVDAAEWFPGDYRILNGETMMLWEQYFPATRNSIVTCLWTA